MSKYQQVCTYMHTYPGPLLSYFCGKRSPLRDVVFSKENNENVNFVLPMELFYSLNVNERQFTEFLKTEIATLL